MTPTEASLNRTRELVGVLDSSVEACVDLANAFASAHIRPNLMIDEAEADLDFSASCVQGYSAALIAHTEAMARLLDSQDAELDRAYEDIKRLKTDLREMEMVLGLDGVQWRSEDDALREAQEGGEPAEDPLRLASELARGLDTEQRQQALNGIAEVAIRPDESLDVQYMPDRSVEAARYDTALS